MSGEQASWQNTLQQIFDGLRPAEQVPAPRFDPSVIANAQGDDQILKVLKHFLEGLGEEDLPPECDILMERLSFTSISVLPARRLRAWTDFIKEKNVWVDTLGALAIARWYEDHGQLNHAASVYEALDVAAYGGEEGFGHDYLLDMLRVYCSLGEYPRARDLFADLRRLANDKTIEGHILRSATQALAELTPQSNPEIGVQDLQERTALLNTYLTDTVNELANAKFEIERLKAGVNIPEERLKAKEWLKRSVLQNTICAESWDSLVDAVLFVNIYPRSGVYWCIPVSCQKAVEAEFNKSVWVSVRGEMSTKQLGHFKYDLSINKICKILNSRASERRDSDLIQNLKTMKQLKHFIRDPTILGNQKKLDALEKHSTDARHGSLGEKKAYTKERLEEFLRQIELDKRDGWIYQWLIGASGVR